MNEKPAVLIFMALVAMVLSSCAPAVKTIGVPETRIYRSKDFVIHELVEGETAQDLAMKYYGKRDLSWRIEEENKSAEFKKGDHIVIPLKPGNRAGISDDGFQTIPILCYHRFGNSCTSPLCMPKGVFEQQMQYLKENGFRTITPKQLIDFLDYKHPLPAKSVMITIDDGYRSVYNTAYPILKKYGFSAVFFIYIDYVGVSKKAITWDQLREMKKNHIYIGSHSVSHSDLSKMKKTETTKTYNERLKKEIFTSKKIIDKKLNQDTLFFSYPFGRQTKKVLDLAEKAGYKIAVTVKRGTNPFFADPYRLKRDQILKRKMDTFMSRLKTFHHLPLK